MLESKRFIADWAATKTSLIMHYFPNYEDLSWGHFSEVELAGAIGKFSTLITDRALSAKTFELSKQMAEVAVEGLVAEWDDGDDICPRPRPHWWDLETNLVPHPEPWKSINAAEQVEIAYLFTKFSALTASTQFNKALKSLAAEIAGSVAGKLADEFEKCGTPPRPRHAQLVNA